MNPKFVIFQILDKAAFKFNLVAVNTAKVTAIHCGVTEEIKGVKTLDQEPYLSTMYLDDGTVYIVRADIDQIVKELNARCQSIAQ